LAEARKVATEEKKKADAKVDLDTSSIKSRLITQTTDVEHKLELKIKKIR